MVVIALPIRRENRHLYPPEWPEISRRIRNDRAQNQCECTGQCRTHHGWCGAVNGQAHPLTGSTVVLTVMHLNHDPTDCRDINLMAGCARCHLAYDREHHEETRRRGLIRQQVQAGQQALFAHSELVWLDRGA